jgi:hypothetical protein
MAGWLVRDGVCELACEHAEARSMATALTTIGSRPVDTGAYLLYPYVERVQREGAELVATVALEAPAP